MEKQIHVILDSMPQDIWADIVSIVSGIIVPILLLVITLIVSSRAEKRSKQYSDELRKSDETRSFQARAHNALDNIYRNVQKLKFNNQKRKYHEEQSQETLKNNDKIMSGSSNEAKVLQQDLIKWHTDKNLELDSEHGMTIIEIASSKSRAQQLLLEEHTSNLDHVIDQILGVAKIPGYFTDGMQEQFIIELNALMKKVEDNPEIWLKP